LIQGERGNPQGSYTKATNWPRSYVRIFITIIMENVDKSSTIMSDEFGGYKDLADKFEAHYIVVRSRQQYVDGIAHTNNIDNFWSMLKRGIYGIYPHVSKKHINKYVDEFEYRHHTRKTKDTQRFNKVLTHLNGRLMYKSLIHQ
jgi:hypothetical protein